MTSGHALSSFALGDFVLGISGDPDGTSVASWVLAAEEADQGRGEIFEGFPSSPRTLAMNHRPGQSKQGRPAACVIATSPAV